MMPNKSPTVSIIVPARNEEACLGACLTSLMGQEGVEFEVIVVDDGSTDRTRAIAEKSAVRLISPGPLPAGWTGKNNAVVAGAGEATGRWLLFTDADTVHLPGSLARSVAEAEQAGADMLSYSPEQVVKTFWEKAVMPVVFAELEEAYPPAQVSDPDSEVAAANGQYILIRREAYDAVGGHEAVAHDLLEDVALARAVKKSGRKLLFRYGADAVRTRMYRSYAQLVEGWTKNLALLFPSPVGVALRRMLDALLVIAGLVFFVTALPFGRWWVGGLGLVPASIVWWRIRRANFLWDATLLATWAGLPMFSYLLVRSAICYRTDGVSWKGRKYSRTPGAGKESKVGHSVSDTQG